MIHNKNIYLQCAKKLLAKISIVGYDTVLSQRISLALWNLIMALHRALPYCLVPSLWTTQSLAVSTFDSWSPLSPGLALYRHKSTRHSVFLSCFAVLDVTCSPRVSNGPYAFFLILKYYILEYIIQILGSIFDNIHVCLVVLMFPCRLGN